MQIDLHALEQGLRKRLWVIDVPAQYQREFTTLVLRWIRCSGVEWTIKRLKSLKVDLYRLRAQLEPISWIRKNRRGQVAGTIGALMRWSTQSDRNFRKGVQAFMCYTVFQYSKPTESQVKKFTSAVQAEPPTISVGWTAFYKAVSRSFGGLTVDRKGDVSLLLYRGSPTKRKPQTGNRSVPQDSNVRADMECIYDTFQGRSLVYQFRKLFAPVFEGLDRSPTAFSPLGMWGEVVTEPSEIKGGRIAFLQEPGGKLRSVASPRMAYQLALRHFGKELYSLASTLSWDCTHDQSKPVVVLQGTLRKGVTVHSVDLSSATDYFPLEVQVNVLKSLYGNIPDIDLFQIISRSTWDSPVGTIAWRRGQPLGLFPSFAAFAVTHGMLLWFLNGSRHEEKFFVLGDDVVILDDNLYHRYIKTLQEWGCPYSPDKSLSSNLICEFAGKVITSAAVTPQYKWREMSNDNFIDIARQLGPRSRLLLTRRQCKVFDAVKHLTPLFAYGLNFSYPGSNLREMEDHTFKVLQTLDEKVLDSLVDQSRIVYRNLYGSQYTPSSNFHGETRVDTRVMLKKVMTLDERVRQVLKSVLPWFRSKNQDTRLYSSVPGGVGRETDLPLAVLQPSRMTTLDRLERLLNLE